MKDPDMRPVYCEDCEDWMVGYTYRWHLKHCKCGALGHIKGLKRVGEQYNEALCKSCREANQGEV